VSHNQFYLEAFGDLNKKMWRRWV